MFSLTVLLLLGQLPPSVTLSVGETRELDAPTLQRALVSGVSVYRLERRPSGRVAIIGVEPGEANFLGVLADGSRVFVHVVVEAKRRPDAGRGS